MQPPHERPIQQPGPPCLHSVAGLSEELARLVIERAMAELAGRPHEHQTGGGHSSVEEEEEIKKSKIQEMTKDSESSSHLDADAMARQIDSIFLDSLAGTNVSPSSSTLDHSSGHESLIAEELALLYESSAGSSLDRQFCGLQSASESTLRRIKLDTFRDLAVCGQQRKSVDLARRLFSGLERRDSGLSNMCQMEDGEPAGLSDAERHEEEEEEEGTRLEEPAYDIKLVRRAGSSVSSCNFRQTLVCSVSPLADNQSAHSTNHSSATNSSDCLQHPLYPIDGPEIQQCRDAFRENRRLIEELQEHVGTHNNRPSSCPLGASSINTNTNTDWWADRLRREQERASERMCSHCRKRVYPVDKIELDFTKLTLEMHKNCFRCRVCSTLLRLETYASIDGKLYCPSHVRQARPVVGNS